MNYIFIVNPEAGSGDNLLVYHNIVKAFEGKEDKVILRLTACEGDATQVAADVCKAYGKDGVIVSCGGDGTLNEILMGMEGETPLMVLPMGTGNDFAKKIYGAKKLNLPDVLERLGLTTGLPDYTVRPVDYIDAGERRSLNIMSFGFDTNVARRGKAMTESKPFLGKLAYKLAVGTSLFGDGLRFSIHARLTAVDDDGVEYEMEQDLDYALMAFCNGSYYGGGICPAPDAKLDDGLLDLCYVEPVSIPGALPLIPKYVSGNGARHVKYHLLHVVSGSLRATDGGDLLGNCDGEVFSAPQVDFTLVPRGISICFPNT